MLGLESMSGSLEHRRLDGSGEEDLHLAELAESASRPLEVGPNDQLRRLKNILNLVH